ncbi:MULTISPECIES: ABC transporter permease [unclassified Streptomyces]|uniref:ABC transporter permease n=1 Tax=unclassified Streptomyces TaxID=2593676 RepID=UPI0035DC467B
MKNLLQRRSEKRQDRKADVPASGLTARDLLDEALAGLVQRPGRSVLTSLGAVLGVGAFVAVLGLTATASSQIDSRFNALAATEVNLEEAEDSTLGAPVEFFPSDATARIERLNGVESAGLYKNVSLDGGATVRASVTATRGEEQTEVVAATAGLLQAAKPHLAQGRTFDDYHTRESSRVAVIGTGLASRLGIHSLAAQPAIFVSGQPFTVIGVVERVERKPDLLLSVIVPMTTAREVWGEAGGDGRTRMLVSTRLGAAPQIASEVALALDPAHPEHFKVTPPPDPRTLRGNVTSDLGQLFLLLAGICLVIGTIGIANTTLVSVLERTGEIGLRRAVGARSRHILVQFLGESGTLGALGGLVGTSLGTVTVVVTAVFRDWTPVIHPVIIMSGPVVGLLTGLMAGLYPAWRASRIEPVDALRR